MLAGAAAVALVTIGLLALRWPVYLDAYDQWGVQVKCGSGFGADLLQATFAGTVDRCQHALAARRAWAIPAAAIGWLMIVWLAVPLLKPEAAQRDNVNSPS